MPGPSLDPLDPRMSGDDADPLLVLELLSKVREQIYQEYKKAKFGGDPVGRRAYGEIRDAVEEIWGSWVDRAYGLGLSPPEEEP